MRHPAPVQDMSVLLVYPKPESKLQTSEETKDSVQKAIKPTQLGIQIRRLSKIRNGGIALELPRTQVRAVAEKLNETLSTHVPKKKLPKIKIFEVPTTKESDVAVQESIRKQNFPGTEEREFHCNIKPVYKVGRKHNPTHHWVLELSLNLLKEFRKLGGRIFLGWQSLKVIEHIIVARCYRCQRYGHLAKDCKSPVDVCGHCAKDNHAFEDCPEENWNFSCANCLRAKSDHKHNVNSVTCPSYIRERNRIASQTDYGH